MRIKDSLHAAYFIFCMISIHTHGAGLDPKTSHAINPTVLKKHTSLSETLTPRSGTSEITESDLLHGNTPPQPERPSSTPETSPRPDEIPRTPPSPPSHEVAKLERKIDKERKLGLSLTSDRSEQLSSLENSEKQERHKQLVQILIKLSHTEAELTQQLDIVRRDIAKTQLELGHRDDFGDDSSAEPSPALSIASSESSVRSRFPSVVSSPSRSPAQGSPQRYQPAAPPSLPPINLVQRNPAPPPSASPAPDSVWHRRLRDQERSERRTSSPLAAALFSIEPKEKR